MGPVPSCAFRIRWIQLSLLMIVVVWNIFGVLYLYMQTIVVSIHSIDKYLLGEASWLVSFGNAACLQPGNSHTTRAALVLGSERPYLES